MKRYIVLLLTLSVFLLLKAGTPVASIVLSVPAVSTNLTHYATTATTAEGYTVQMTMGNLDCRMISVGKYAYFNVNDLTIPSTQNNIIFNVTYFDEGLDRISLQYNATGTNYKNTTVTKTGTNTWITAKIAIADAKFQNLQNNSSDFRISGTSVNYIREITIETGVLNPALEAVPSVSASSYSEFTGKSVAGYQLWFNTGTATSGWYHWSGTSAPSNSNVHVEVYPDVTEYDQAELAPTALANLGNGETSKFFNSSKKNVIDKHFEWMKNYGIDGAAVQRFISNIGWSIISSPYSNPMKVK